MRLVEPEHVRLAAEFRRIGTLPAHPGFSYYPRRRPMRSPVDMPPVPARNMRFRIRSYEDIPLERLRPHLDPKAIEQAIERALVCGVRQLGGVKIWEDDDGRQAA